MATVARRSKHACRSRISSPLRSVLGTIEGALLRLLAARHWLGCERRGGEISAPRRCPPCHCPCPSWTGLGASYPDLLPSSPGRRSSSGVPGRSSLDRQCLL